MQILGKKINSNIFNDSADILRKWDRTYRKTLSILDAIRPGKNQFRDNLALIHTLRYMDSNNCPFLSAKAEDIFASWDIISSSLIRIQSSFYDRNQWADVGFLLAVPAQNIIGTFHADAWFPNHAGNGATGRKNSYELTESYFQGISKTKNPKRLERLKKIMPEQTYANMYTPDTLINKSDGLSHNEVLIVGKRDVNIYADYPPTSRIKVCAIYFEYTSGQKETIAQYHKNRELIAKLQEMNPELPVIEHAVWGGSVSNFKW